MEEHAWGCESLQRVVSLGYLRWMRVYCGKTEDLREILTFPMVDDEDERPVIILNRCPFCGIPFTGGGPLTDGVPLCDATVRPRVITETLRESPE